jgi:class 3 adenylate cyclase
VLFSDLCDYTTLAERLDPEELKDIVTWMFDRIAQVVAKYEGTVERFIGDAVMALFGAPRACEDHAVRAIRAAGEIHHVIARDGVRFIERTGAPMAMHSGVNTGLVVTGKADPRKGLHGVAGHALGVAARLQGLAGRGEVLAGEETFHQAEGYFVFERVEPRKVEGRETQLAAYRVIAPVPAERDST